MVKLIPSPDWFVGIASFDLCERRRWKKHVEIDLYPTDAGTDKGLAFSSPNWPSKPAEPIYQLSPTKPAHVASSFNYPDVESLPPIAKVQLTKISGTIYLFLILRQTLFFIFWGNFGPVINPLRPKRLSHFINCTSQFTI